jgi:hypothetical protein
MHDFSIFEIIIDVVAAEGGCKAKDLRDFRRCPSLCRLRDTMLFLARKKTQLSFPELGQRLAGRHHTTIIAACRREGERLKRKLPKRADGRTLAQWHAHLEQKIDALIEAGVVVRTPAPPAPTLSEATSVTIGAPVRADGATVLVDGQPTTPFPSPLETEEDDLDA